MLHPRAGTPFSGTNAMPGYVVRIIPAGDGQSKKCEADNLLDHLDRAILTVWVTGPQDHTPSDSTGRARSSTRSLSGVKGADVQNERRKLVKTVDSSDRERKDETRMTPAALGALLRGDKENFIGASTPGGIEAQEARGQRDFVVNETLPIKCNFCEREQLEQMGIVFSDEIDSLFVRVQLPGYELHDPQAATSIIPRPCCCPVD